MRKFLPLGLVVFGLIFVTSHAYAVVTKTKAQVSPPLSAPQTGKKSTPTTAPTGSAAPAAKNTVMLSEDATTLGDTSTASVSDISPPRIVGFKPTSGQTGVTPLITMQVIHDETLAPEQSVKRPIILTRAGRTVYGRTRVDSKTIVFTPTSPLEFAAEYNVQVVAGITDSNGNATTAATQWSFTTMDEPTEFAVVDTIPADGGVANQATPFTLTVAFNRQLNGDCLARLTVSGPDGNAVETTESCVGRTLTAVPLRELAWDTAYTAVLDTGAADLYGIPLASAHSWSFTTPPEPLKVYVTIPDNGATIPYPGALTINVYFTRELGPSFNCLAHYHITDSRGAVVAATGFCTERLFVTVPQLAENETYTLTVGTGMEDARGVGMAVPYTVRFYTGFGAFTVLATTPADGAGGFKIKPGNRLDYGTPVKAHLNRPADSASVIRQLTLTKPNGDTVGGSVYVSDNDVTFRPAVPWAYSTTYTAEITTAVKDTHGQFLASPVTWSFTTEPEALAVTSTFPQNNAAIARPGDVPLIYATFSRLLDPTSCLGNGFTLTDDAGGNLRMTVNCAGPTVTATNVTLAWGRTYTARLAGSIRDSNGFALGEPYAWDFTTPTPATPLSVTEKNPPADALLEDLSLAEIKAVLNRAPLPTICPEYAKLYKDDVEMRGVVPRCALNELKIPVTLQRNSEYRVSLANGIIDEFGNRLNPPVTWRFATVCDNDCADNVLCADNADCQSGYCAVPSGGHFPVCVAGENQLPVGVTCATDAACQTDICGNQSGRCEAPAGQQALGELCRRDTACASAVCNPATGACSDRLTDGDACVHGEQCEDGLYCDTGVCAPPCADTDDGVNFTEIGEVTLARDFAPGSNRLIINPEAFNDYCDTRTHEQTEYFCQTANRDLRGTALRACQGRSLCLNADDACVYDANSLALVGESCEDHADCRLGLECRRGRCREIYRYQERFDARENPGYILHSYTPVTDEPDTLGRDCDRDRDCAGDWFVPDVVCENGSCEIGEDVAERRDADEYIPRTIGNQCDSDHDCIMPLHSDWQNSPPGLIPEPFEGRDVVCEQGWCRGGYGSPVRLGCSDKYPAQGADTCQIRPEVENLPPGDICARDNDCASGICIIVRRGYKTCRDGLQANGFGCSSNDDCLSKQCDFSSGDMYNHVCRGHLEEFEYCEASPDCAPGLQCNADNLCIRDPVPAEALSGCEDVVEMVPGFNNTREDRIDLIFVPVYSSSRLRQRLNLNVKHQLLKHIDFAQTEAFTGDTSLFNISPFAQNRERFNLWIHDHPMYVDDRSFFEGIGDWFREAFGEDETLCKKHCANNFDSAQGCNLSDKIVVNICLLDKYCHSQSQGEDKRVYISMRDKPGDDITFMGNGSVTTHELGHNLGGLADEYTSASGDDLPNCAENRSEAKDQWGYWEGDDYDDVEIGYFNGCEDGDYIMPTKNSMMRNSWKADSFGLVNSTALCYKILRKTGRVSDDCIEAIEDIQAWRRGSVAMILDDVKELFFGPDPAKKRLTPATMKPPNAYAQLKSIIFKGATAVPAPAGRPGRTEFAKVRQSVEHKAASGEPFDEDFAGEICIVNGECETAEGENPENCPVDCNAASAGKKQTTTIGKEELLDKWGKTVFRLKLAKDGKRYQVAGSEVLRRVYIDEFEPEEGEGEITLDIGGTTLTRKISLEEKIHVDDLRSGLAMTTTAADMESDDAGTAIEKIVLGGANGKTITVDSELITVDIPVDDVAGFEDFASADTGEAKSSSPVPVGFNVKIDAPGKDLELEFQCADKTCTDLNPPPPAEEKAMEAPRQFIDVEEFRKTAEEAANPTATPITGTAKTTQLTVADTPGIDEEPEDQAGQTADAHHDDDGTPPTSSTDTNEEDADDAVAADGDTAEIQSNAPAGGCSLRLP